DAALLQGACDASDRGARTGRGHRDRHAARPAGCRHHGAHPSGGRLHGGLKARPRPPADAARDAARAQHRPSHRPRRGRDGRRVRVRLRVRRRIRLRRLRLRNGAGDTDARQSMIGAMGGTGHRDTTCTVMGVELYAGGLEGAARAVIERALSKQGGYASRTGVHGLTLSQSDPGLRHALHEAWVNFPDGAPVAWRQRRNGSPHAERIAGPDLMPRVIDLGREHGLRHYLFGATPAVLERLEANLLRRYPGAQIVGTSSPPFRAMNAPEEREAVAAITATA